MSNQVTRFFLLSTTLGMGLFCLPSRQAGALGPKDVVVSSHAGINRLLQMEAKGHGSKASLDAKMKKIINTFLDFDTLAQASMVKHWTTMTEAQRTEYTTLFKQVIEANYIKRLRGDLNYRVVYGQVKISGRSAVVPTTVERMKSGRKSETTIIYKLKKASTEWRVIDVVTNDVSLADNYKRSFGKIMRQEGFPTLIRKMKRRIARLR